MSQFLSIFLSSFRVAINRIPIQDATANRFYQLFLNESDSIRRFSDFYANDTIPPRYSGAAWRTYCYYRRLYAMPTANATGTYARTITAQFYRENPAQIHRLVPWLNRELICLCATSVNSIQTVLENVLQLIQTIDMTSREFRRRVSILVPNHTNHFIHELINYARSPYDMIGYDRNVQYNPIFINDAVVVVSSSDDDDVSIVPMQPEQIASTSGGGASAQGTNENSTNNLINNNINNTSMIIMSTDSSDNSGDEQNGNNHQRNIEPEITLSVDNNVACNITHNYEDSDEEIINYLQNETPSVDEILRGRQATPQIPQPQTSESINPINSTIHTNNDRSVIVRISSHASTSNSTFPAPPTTVPDDSDSDDCQFVCAKKPPHLRTPEFVELNSESDSDVVFVDEEKILQPPTIKQENKEPLSLTIRKRKLRNGSTIVNEISPICNENQEAIIRTLMSLPSTSSQEYRLSPLRSYPPYKHTVIRTSGKRMYESTDSDSSSMNTDDEEGSSGNRSSSHEEYVVPLSSRKQRKPSTKSIRKKYRKSKSKSKKTKTKSSHKRKSERPQKRYKRSLKMENKQNNLNSSSSNISSDSESDN